MLDFAESVLGKVRHLRTETQHKILSGAIKDMEQYRYLQGRLEAYDFVEAEIKDLLGAEKEYLS